MKNLICPIANVSRLEDGFDFLQCSDDKMMFVYGESGTGKTSALEYLAQEKGCYFWRGMPQYTPYQVCLSLLEACGGSTYKIYSYGKAFKALVEHLADSDRSILIDECGFLRKNVELIRALHDLTGVPILIAGLPNFYNVLNLHPQVSDRIYFVEFSPWSLKDASLVANMRCEVRIGPELIEKAYCYANSLIEESGGMRANARLLCRIFAGIERQGITDRVDEVTVEMWGNQPFLPQFSKKPNLSKTRRRAA